jgi:pre-mRNA-processing factor 8
MLCFFKMKIKQWTLFLQKNFKKSFKNLRKNINFKKKKIISLFSISIKKKDKRIFIGGIKYIPFVITNFLKNCPMPWDYNFFLKILIHPSGILFVLNENMRVLEPIFLSQWCIWWVFLKKIKKNKKDFNRINFPIFDDEETTMKYSKINWSKCKKFFLKNKKILLNQNTKGWFLKNSILFQSFLKNFSKKQIYLDFIFVVFFMQIQMFSGLVCFKYSKYLHKRSFYLIKKRILELKKKIINFNFFFLKNNSKYVNIEKKKKKDNKKLSIFKIKEKIFDVKLKNFFTFYGFKKVSIDFNCQNDINYRKFNGKFIKKKFIHLQKKKKKKFLEFCLPFFFDFFFSEKRIAFFFKFYSRIKFNNIFKLTLPYKVPFLKKLIFNLKISNDSIVLTSLINLLKFYIFKVLKKKIFKKKKLTTYKIFKKNYFFYFYKGNWIDIGIQISFQSYNMLILFLGRKNLFFLNLDFNFNLKPIKTLTTKERKKSRFSNSFHLLREILRFSKIIIDVHIQFKIGNIDSFQLSDGINYIFTHVGLLTGLYRYKYKIMRQIRICKIIKFILVNNFFKKKDKNIGFGFWAPFWRIWIFFLQGITPVLERWLSNLLVRHFQGRKTYKKSLKYSQQRYDAYFDIGFKQSFLEEIFDVKNFSINYSLIKKIFKFLNEAWKCWKSNMPWSNAKIPKIFEMLILKYIKLKANWWILTTFQFRKKIKKGIIMNKNVLKKNLGRMTRLWFKIEQKKQLDFLIFGPFLSKKIAIETYKIFFRWLDLVNFKKIPFPSFSYKTDLKLLILALENLKESENFNNKKLFVKNNGKNILEEALNDPFYLLRKIKGKILIQKTFKQIGIIFLDNFSFLIPVFKIEIDENIIDSFLDHYFWNQSTKNLLFPKWIKPSDSEIAPFFVYKLCSNLNNLNMFEYKNSKANFCLFQAFIIETFENIDLSFLQQLLELILDLNLVNFIVSRFGTTLSFKNMTLNNLIGVISGINFSSFIIQLYSLIIDIIFLGIKNAFFLNFQILPENNLLRSFENESIEIVFYARYISEIIIIVDINSLEHNENFAKSFLIKNKFSVLNSNFKKKFFIKNLISLFEEKIPNLIGRISFLNYYQKITEKDFLFSKFNFELCGFNIFSSFSIQKKKKYAWKFKHILKEKKILYFTPLINNISIKQFENRIRIILLNSNSTTFTKIINKWNSNIFGTILYFREGCFENFIFRKIELKSEYKLQTRIKISFNTKMPSRFPPVLFYSPKELGGLGMFSLSKSNIPENDFRFFKVSKVNRSIDRKKSEQPFIPSINDYILIWELEFLESQLIWSEYLKRRINKKNFDKFLSVEDISDLWNKGIPRINTLFQKDRHILAFDHGWRIRREFKKYNQTKTDLFWWTNSRHDGKLWDLNNYRVDIVNSLGGIENILEHTLFKGTFFPSWEGLFWEKTSGFESSTKFKKLTTAQRSGLNQIPNRRFTLWWSPTINRGSIYIGFQVQLDLTGIFMHGKIPTLKISFIQIFRAHLWQKIHESICIHISQKLDEKAINLEIQSVQKEIIHPRKSYKMNSSCPDIVLFATEFWEAFFPSILSFSNYNEEKKCALKTNKFWIDVQLRWGDFDSHDIERYVRGKFYDFNCDKKSIYPSKTGIIIGFDLAYNVFSAYGYWIKGIKIILSVLLAQILKTNPALFILRERIRKGLQLYVSEKVELFLNSENFSDIFYYKNTWLIDDSCLYRVSIHRTIEGNLISKPTNGVILIFKPHSGIIFIKIFTNYFWKGKKKLNQFAKWKAAEEISKLINNTPSKYHPKLIISMRKNIIDPLSIHLIQFPDIVIKGSEIKIPFFSLLQIEKIANKIKNSNLCEILIYTLYDDWLDIISPFTCFSRIILILKSIEIDFQKFSTIFGKVQFPFSNKNFWPNFSDYKWIQIEILLKNFIIEDFCKKKKFTSKNFTQNDVRNIIFAGKINFDNEIENEKIETIFFANEYKTKKSEKKIFFQNEKEKIIIQAAWKSFNFYNLNFSIISKISVEFKFFKKDLYHKCIFPKNLIKFFLGLNHLNLKTIGFLYGKKIKNAYKLFKIQILIIPPQICRNLHLEIAYKIPKNEFITDLFFQGFLRGKVNFEKNFSIKNDVSIINSFILKNFIKFTDKLIFLKMTISFKNCRLSSWSIYNTNQKFILSKKNPKFQILLTKRIFGFFLIPKNFYWNNISNSFLFFKEKKYSLHMSIPSMINNSYIFKL